MSPSPRPEPPASPWFFCHPDRSDTAFLVCRSLARRFGARFVHSCIATVTRNRPKWPIFRSATDHVGSCRCFCHALQQRPSPPPSRPRPLTHPRSNPRAGIQPRSRASRACSFPAWDSSTIVIRAKRSSWLLSATFLRLAGEHTCSTLLPDDACHPAGHTCSQDFYPG